VDPVSNVLHSAGIFDLSDPCLLLLPLFVFTWALMCTSHFHLFTSPSSLSVMINGSTDILVSRTLLEGPSSLLLGVFE